MSGRRILYCNDCADEQEWPKRKDKNFGRCEFCFWMGPQNHQIEDKLPKPKTRRRPPRDSR